MIEDGRGQTRNSSRVKSSLMKMMGLSIQSLPDAEMILVTLVFQYCRGYDVVPVEAAIS